MLNASLRRQAASPPLATDPPLTTDQVLGLTDQVPPAKRVTMPTSLLRDEVLPQQAFLKQLHRERRRVDRSRAPMSIVVLKHEQSRMDNEGKRVELMSILIQIKRETDVVGELENGRIAVLLLDTDRKGSQVFTNKLALQAADLPFVVAVGTYPDQLFDAVDGQQRELADFRSLFLEEGRGETTRGYPAKRALDIVGALAGLVLTSPLMLATAFAVMLTSPGPAIFRQTRLGRHGKPFVFYKFRSMHTNNNDSIHREFVSSLIQGEHDQINQGDASNPSYKMKRDPRITRVGLFIRKTSLDELPQLWNVLKGDMSLVGPRPALPYEVEKYKSWHMRRVLEVRPGITGLWQVEGRSRTTFDEMVRLDLRYVRNCSLRNDLSILAKTVAAVVRRDGAG